MKVTVKRKDSGEKSIPITTEFIRLEALLKLADAVPSGGMAKNLIQDGEVMVNDEICTMRGKKLRPGDEVRFMGGCWRVTEDAAE